MTKEKEEKSSVKGLLSKKAVYKTGKKKRATLVIAQPRNEYHSLYFGEEYEKEKKLFFR